MSTSSSHFDVAIIGGGATGCALALGLQAKTNLRVVLIDAGSPPEAKQQGQDSNSFDQRTIALSVSSLAILKAFGCELDALQATPIEHIHVSDKGHAGQTLLHAQDYQLDAFGQVLSLTQIGCHLYSRLQTDAQLSYLANTSVQQVVRTQEMCTLRLDDNRVLTANLVVLSDGGRSNIAQQLGFTRTDKDYQQTAITLALRTSEPHAGWAYERFTDAGPLALLPMAENQFGVVWTVPSEQVDYWLAQSDEAVMAELQAQFGYRCGVITAISERKHFPLHLKRTESAISHRCVAIGNSAQTLHPIAGQGVNLGFRDVFDLVTTLGEATEQTDQNEQQSDCGRFANLQHYQSKRVSDQAATVGLTDLLVTVFSNQHLPFVVARNLGLTALNLQPIAKQAFAASAMGGKHAAL